MHNVELIKSNLFIQHVPGYIDIEPIILHFDTQEELMQSEVINRYAIYDHTFMWSNWSEENDGTLMIVKNDNTYWWVVGKIKKPELLNFPIWKGPNV